MAAEIARVCGPAEAAGYRRFVDFVSRALPARDARLHRPQHRLAARPARARPRAARGDRRVPPAGAQGRAYLHGPADCSGSSPSRRCTPGCRRTTRSRSTPSSPTWTRSPACSSRAAGCTRCRGRWPARPRSTASRSGTATTVDAGRASRRPGRGRAHRPTASGSPCDVVVLNPDLPVAHRDLLGREPLVGRPAAVLAVVLPAARRVDGRRTRKTAHHNIHFGRAWRRRLRRDHRRRPADERPVAAGHQPDPRPTRRSRRRHGRSTTCCSRRPNLDAADRLGARPAPRYRDEVVATLEARGYVGFGDGIEVEHADHPARLGGPRHGARARRSRPRTPSARPGRSGRATCWGENVVFAGSGTQPGRRRPDGADLRAAGRRAHHRPRPPAIGRFRPGR